MALGGLECRNPLPGARGVDGGVCGVEGEHRKYAGHIRWWRGMVSLREEA